MMSQFFIFLTICLLVLVPGSHAWFRRVVRTIVKPITCTQSVCTTTYGGWKPISIPAGRCITQSNYATHHHTQRTEKVVGTCKNRGCGANVLKRTRCNCAEIITCQWSGWRSWSGHINDGACAKQTRTRYPDRKYRYHERADNCNGIKKDCLNTVTSDSQHRTRCKCKSTQKCVTTSWTPWYPSPVPGKCATQRSRRNVAPQHTIIERADNCHGIVSTCSLPTTKSRTFCSCQYKQCNLQPWTQWGLTSNLNADNCPLEGRQRIYQAIVKYKDAHNSCNGIGPQSCPSNIPQSRDEVRSCPNLNAPSDGKLDSDQCYSSKSSCGSLCPMKCNQGYKQNGNRYSRCGKSGSWDRSLGTCQDHIPPQITCPVLNDYDTLPNKNYAMVTVPAASATDNTGSTPTITASQNSPVKTIVNQPQPIVYRAKDKAGNEDSCKVFVNVIDTEPPKIITCPDDMTVTPPVFPYPVVWEEPKFTDNVDGDNVKKYPSHHNGQQFSEGAHHVRIIARDNGNNNATCEFVVQVSKAVCPTHDPPKHGSKSCNIQRSGKNETYVCSVGCDSGYHFPKLPDDVKVYDFYVCGEEGNWRGQDKFDPMNPVFFVPIPRDQRPWSECAKITDVTNPGYGSDNGGCVSDTEKTAIKQDFVNQLQSDPILSQLYCTVGAGDNCHVSNVIVTCDAANAIVVDFKPSPPKAKVTQSKTIGGGISAAKTITTSRRILIPLSAKTKLNNLLVALAARKNQERKDQEAVRKCGYGSILLSAQSTSSGKEECMLCPIGTYHDVAKNKCERCPIGQYQALDGQRSCVSCAEKLSTVAQGAKSETDCKDICYPGSHSKSGLATCLACKIGFYQPLYRQTACMQCPDGKTTRVPGAALATDCQ